MVDTGQLSYLFHIQIPHGKLNRKKPMKVKMMSPFTNLLILVLMLSLIEIAKGSLQLNTAKLSRNDFPVDFIFGSGSSAYQVEGAAAEDGRTPSIWDTFAHAGNLPDKSNGDIACDQYHKYKEDVQLMAKTRLDAYRLSISWSRLIPNGRGAVNPKGLMYYNNLIDELISNGIQPHVTLFHYDTPQALEDEYGGWLSRKIVKDFTAYADLCFKEFGDRVSHWTTLNEANVFALLGYDVGFLPPQRCSPPFGINCKAGNSTTEPYIVAHNCLLGHASAARLYKETYQEKQQGFIGLNIFSYWLVPESSTTQDISATQRANDFYIGWFINPLVFGDYPNIMKMKAGSRIPVFQQQELEQVKGSYDFIGVNHYSTMYVRDETDKVMNNQSDVIGDMATKLIAKWDGMPAGEFPINSFGLQGVLEYFKHVYGNLPIFIQENGQITPHNASLNDTSRVRYLESYTGSLLNALRNGSNVQGYFTWSFLDSFELLNGFQSSFGLYYVDLNDPDLKRSPKLSAYWYTNFLKRGSTQGRGQYYAQ